MFNDLTLVRETNVTLGRRTTAVQLQVEDAFKSGTDKLPSDVAIVTAIGRVLYSQYPGHPWHVEVMSDQGIAKITLPCLLGMNWGYVLHLDKLDSPKPVIEAGGHILERFNIPRSTIDFAHYIAAKDKIPLLGNFRAKHRKLIPA